MAEALAAMDGAEAIAAELRIPRLELSVLAFRLLLFLELGAPGSDLAEMGRALESGFEALGSSFSKGRAVGIVGWIQLDRGDEAGALTRFAQARDLADGVMTEGLFVHRIEMRAWARAGRPDELEAAATRLCEIAGEGSPSFFAAGRLGMAWAASLRGNDEAAVRLAREALASGPMELDMQWRAQALLARSIQQAEPSEAEALRADAASTIGQIAEALPERQREWFVAQPEAAGLLVPETG